MIRGKFMCISLAVSKTVHGVRKRDTEQVTQNFPGQTWTSDKPTVSRKDLTNADMIMRQYLCMKEYIFSTCSLVQLSHKLLVQYVS